MSNQTPDNPSERQASAGPQTLSLKIRVDLEVEKHLRRDHGIQASEDFVVALIVSAGISLSRALLKAGVPKMAIEAALLRCNGTKKDEDE